MAATPIAELGAKLRKARELLGWTRSEAAQALGSSTTQIMRYERDAATVPVWYLVRLADALGMSVDGLLGREQPGPMITVRVDDHTVFITPQRQVFRYAGELPVSLRDTELPDVRLAVQLAMERARAEGRSVPPGAARTPEVRPVDNGS